MSGVKVYAAASMLAKSDGKLLVEHCLEVARGCLDKAREAGWPMHMQEAAYLCGLLHDAGKALPEIQAYLHSKLGRTAEGAASTISSSTVLHHEASWAACVLLLPENSDEVLPRANLTTNSRVVRAAMQSAVYWHHPQSSQWVKGGTLRPVRAAAGDILPTSAADAIASCKAILSELFKKASEDPALLKHSQARGLWASLPGSLGMHGTGSVPVPPIVPLTNKSSGSIEFEDYATMALRAILISADREASGRQEHRVSHPVCSGPSPLPEGYDRVRWDQQESIVSDVLSGWERGENSPIVVNAPAGFGKTSLGVSIAARTGGQVFWVCPRNEVATSVYHSILKELEVTGSTRTAELFLGGKQKESHGGAGAFQSSIVVTNIDNLLKGTSANGDSANHLWPALSSTVVFDEYHELPNTGGLLYYFLTFMRARTHFMGSARTVLLSATGHSVPCELWDSATVRTRHLPGRYQHMPAAHTKPYHLSVCKDPSSVSLGKGEVFIFNSVANAQGLAFSMGVDSTVCVHSKFCDTDYTAIMAFLESEFGKSGARSAKVSSAPVLQAAKDISFVSMYESVSSAENTLQRLGRNNRWGYQDSARFVIVVPDERTPKTAVWNTKSESCARALQVGKPLGDLWRKEVLALLDKGPKTLTLDEVYRWYNGFCEKNATAIYDSYKKDGRELKKSAEDAGKIYPAVVHPAKVSSAKKGKHYERRGAEGNLRNPDASYFVAPLCYTDSTDEDNSGRNFSEDVVLPLEGELLTELCSKDLWDARGLHNASVKMVAQGQFPLLAELLDGWALPKIKKGGKAPGAQLPLEEWKRIVRQEGSPYPTMSWVYKRVTDQSLRARGLLGLGLDRRGLEKESWE